MVMSLAEQRNRLEALLRSEPIKGLASAVVFMIFVVAIGHGAARLLSD
jgi:hypothetical protein